MQNVTCLVRQSNVKLKQEAKSFPPHWILIEGRRGSGSTAWAAHGQVRAQLAAQAAQALCLAACWCIFQVYIKLAIRAHTVCICPPLTPQVRSHCLKKCCLWVCRDVMGQAPPRKVAKYLEDLLKKRLEFVRGFGRITKQHSQTTLCRVQMSLC